ncbi:hypothetical protein BJX66DRAFT_319486 [Aspergillus keveii]|uniref:Short-chain dehydrogenase/reductase family protein n=1 Tax=Aspergillus keveii TaxID=714993 RepID=A0ABR4FI67_9EURO
MANFTSAAITKRATQGAFVRRQLFGEPPKVSPKKINLSGRTAIVTGANTGIGFECCAQLLDLGVGSLIMAVRSLPKGEEAKQQLLSSKRNAQCQISVCKLDLASYDSITAFVDYTTTLDRLDIVINNAGVCKRSFELDPKTGHEESIQVNYLGNALFVILMIPVLRQKSPVHPGRMTFVSSDTPAWAEFKEKDSIPLLTAFDKRQSFKFQDRYATSKLLGQLFLQELAKRVSSSVVVINAPNPGLCKSGLDRDFKGSMVGYAARFMQFLIARDASVGARALVDAAVNHGPASHGQYVEDGKVVPMAPFVYQPRGEAIAKQLWQETMAELSFADVEGIINRLGK